MTDVAAVEINGLSKRFGSVQAVSDMSFEVNAGRVTGFLGPNGAGKSTTLRCLLGLIHADRGTGTFGGKRYEELEHPSAHVGAVLENASFHPGRSGRNHLRVLAAAGRHSPRRVSDLLEQVGLSAAADRRVKGYSMGMRQRLAIAAALLGDPRVLILDEPTNGLDPPGIRWVRDLLRAEAARGRAVLVSSHLLSEVEQSVDEVVVIAKGMMRASGPIEHVLGGGSEPVTRVRSADSERLAGLLRERGIAVDGQSGDLLLVHGVAPEAVGEVAAEHRVVLRELGAQTRSLEDAFFRAHGARRMTALLQAELIKLRTTRTFLALTAAAVGTSLLITVLVSVLTEPDKESVLTDVFTSDTSSLFITVLAVVGITGAWRHHTITSSLLAAPDRLRFFFAKLVAFAAAGLVLSLLISIAVAVVELVILSVRDLPVPEAGELIGQIARNALVAALLGAFGVGIGALVRNKVVAVVGLLVAGFAVDPAVAALAPDIGRFSPFGALPVAVQDLDPEDAGIPGDLELLSPGLALLAMLAWIGSAFAVGAALLIRRDLD